MSSVFRTVEQAEDQAAQQWPVLLLEPWQREAAPAGLFAQRTVQQYINNLAEPWPRGNQESESFKRCHSSRQNSHPEQ